MILRRLEELGIPFEDCGGQSYDNGANMKCKNKGVQARLLWRFSTAWYGTVRHGSVRYGTAQFGSVAFPPQFSTAIEWAGLFTRRYNCAASTAVTSS